MKQEASKAEEIILNCLKINDYLKTIKKSIMTDAQDMNQFEDHYSDLIQVALDINWSNHEAAEQISRDDFRRNLKIK